MGFWNCDSAYRAVCITGRVSRQGKPFGGAQIESVGVSYSGYAPQARSLHSNGLFTVMAQCNSKVKLNVVYSADGDSTEFGVFLTPNAGDETDAGDLAV